MHAGQCVLQWHLHLLLEQAAEVVLAACGAILSQVPGGDHFSGDQERPRVRDVAPRDHTNRAQGEPRRSACLLCRIQILFE